MDYNTHPTAQIVTKMKTDPRLGIVRPATLVWLADVAEDAVLALGGAVVDFVCAVN
jgi:hypothetical protein